MLNLTEYAQKRCAYYMDMKDRLKHSPDIRNEKYKYNEKKFFMMKNGFQYFVFAERTYDNGDIAVHNLRPDGEYDIHDKWKLIRR